MVEASPLGSGRSFSLSRRKPAASWCGSDLAGGFERPCEISRTAASGGRSTPQLRWIARKFEPVLGKSGPGAANLNGREQQITERPRRRHARRWERTLPRLAPRPSASSGCRLHLRLLRCFILAGWWGQSISVPHRCRRWIIFEYLHPQKSIPWLWHPRRLSLRSRNLLSPDLEASH
jgi:hypothetical protein